MSSIAQICMPASAHAQRSSFRKYSGKRAWFFTFAMMTILAGCSSGVDDQSISCKAAPLDTVPPLLMEGRFQVDTNDNGLADGFEAAFTQGPDLDSDLVDDRLDADFDDGVDNNANGVADVFEVSLSGGTDKNTDGVDDDRYMKLIAGDCRLQPAVVVNSDGSDTFNSYELFTTALDLNKTASVIQDRSLECGHSNFGRHITEYFDPDLGKNVFEFHLHVNEDKECELPGENPTALNNERQRVMIETQKNSVRESIATLGEWHTVRWNFKLPQGFQASHNWTELMRIKTVGVDDQSPLLALAPRLVGDDNRTQLAVDYRQSTAAGLTRLTPIDFGLVENRWVNAFVRFKSDVDGYFEIVLRDTLTGQVLMSYQNDSLMLWRPGTSRNSIRLGLFRSRSERELLRDETVRFSDICIAEGSRKCP